MRQEHNAEFNYDLPSYRLFMNDVNSILMWRLGATSNDLPDYLWLDCYRDGLAPEEAVDSYIDDFWTELQTL